MCSERLAIVGQGYVGLPIAMRAVDAIVLLTDHDDLQYELLTECGAFVLDTRRKLKTGAEALL